LNNKNAIQGIKWKKILKSANPQVPNPKRREILINGAFILVYVLS
jgi:hypothetical protein